jgi:uncharacterized protein YjbI with pentapeptide repeats
MTTCNTKVKKEKNFISLDQLIERNKYYPANKKFFELIEKHKEGERKDFVEEWNNWVESDKNKDLTLDFSDFHFDINNKEVKDKFSVLSDSFWNFNDLHFPRKADFCRATFKGEADFHYATFKGRVQFSRSTFKGRVQFSRSTFEEEADFSDATFEEEADFSDATFEGGTNFFYATFKGEADFCRATFKGEADFHYATFKGRVQFSRSTFKGRVQFSRSTFEEEVDFFDATFEKYVYFNIKYSEKNEEICLILTRFDSKSFFNMKLLSRANLSNASIDVGNINLFPDVKIKEIKKTPDNYRFFRRYYASKLDHDSERECFALELESKFPFNTPKKWQDIKGWIKYIDHLGSSPIHIVFAYSITNLYKWISNYGESIIRPIVFISVIYSIISICTGQNYYEVVKCNLPFANIEGCLNGLSKFFGTSCTYIGLFLSGLAIRNKFKIK